MKPIEDILYQKLGDDWGGNSDPPGSTAHIRLHEYPEERDYYGASIVDGGLWLGTGRKWHTSMSPRDARKLAWFVIWRWWIRGTWCGLKTRIWVWALHRHVSKWRAGMRREDVAATIAQAEEQIAKRAR